MEQPPPPEGEPSPEEQERRLHEEVFEKAGDLSDAIIAWKDATIRKEQAQGKERTLEEWVSDQPEALLSLANLIVFAATPRPGGSTPEDKNHIQELMVHAGSLFGYDMSSMMTPQQQEYYRRKRAQERQERAEDQAWLKEQGMKMPENDNDEPET